MLVSVWMSLYDNTFLYVVRYFSLCMLYTKGAYGCRRLYSLESDYAG